MTSTEFMEGIGEVQWNLLTSVQLYSINYLIDVENAIIVDVDRGCYRQPHKIVPAN